jgi:hypothetical protein
MASVASLVPLLPFDRQLIAIVTNVTIVTIVAIFTIDDIDAINANDAIGAIVFKWRFRPSYRHLNGTIDDKWRSPLALGSPSVPLE